MMMIGREEECRGIPRRCRLDFEARAKRWQFLNLKNAEAFLKVEGETSHAGFDSSSSPSNTVHNMADVHVNRRGSIDIAPFAPPATPPSRRFASRSAAPVDILVRSPLGRSTWVAGHIVRKAGATVDVEYDDERRGVVLATLQNDSPLLARAGQYTSRSAGSRLTPAYVDGASATSSSADAGARAASADAAAAAATAAARPPAPAPFSSPSASTAAERQRAQGEAEQMRRFYEEKMQQVVEKLSAELQMEAQAKMEAMLTAEMASDKVATLERTIADLKIDQAQSDAVASRASEALRDEDAADQRERADAAQQDALAELRSTLAAQHSAELAALRAEHDAERERALAALEARLAQQSKEEQRKALFAADVAHDAAMEALQSATQTEMLRIVKQTAVAASAAEVARKNAVEAVARLARAPGQWADRAEDSRLLARQASNVARPRFEDLRLRAATEGGGAEESAKTVV